ncbi:MAG TPA: SDR family oxidoreductase [Actinomycetota bacterium]|nr:SDR family oxidoreductase [Actinomycetota bacterium]
MTGATSGIGMATAAELASMGARVGLVARNAAKGEITLAEIRATSHNDRLDLFGADLSSQASVRALSEDVRRRFSSLNVLVNCAGDSYAHRHTTVDGLELTFALNHLAYFQLTRLLLDLLVASAPSRIVNVTSGAQSVGRIDFEDLQGERRYRGQAAYNQSKLANVLFTYELARRLEGTGVTVNAVHPGVARTRFGHADPNIATRWLTRVAQPFMRTPERGASTVIYLASSPEVEGTTGRYWANLKPKSSSKRSYDVEAAERLWEISEALTGLPAGP